MGALNNFMSTDWIDSNCPFCRMDDAKERSLFCPYASKNGCSYSGYYPVENGKRITIDFIKCAEMRTKEGK